MANAHSIPQDGQGSVEFLLAAVPLLLLGLGSIEAVHWHHTRQAVSLALAQAARAAITQHADPAALDQAFMHALLPLHAAPSPQQARARLERNMQRRTRATGLPAWRLEIVSPSVATFRDFASPDPELPRFGSLEVIDNDYLHEQHQARLAGGWAQGRGPHSRQNTMEANVLVLHLTWLHEPLLPGVRNLLRQLAPADARYGSQAMARGGYLPIRREVAFVMQSHAIAWPMPAHGRVQRSPGPHAETNQSAATGQGGQENISGPLPPSTRAAAYDDTTYGPPGQSQAGLSAPEAGAAGEHPPQPHEGTTASAASRPCTGLWCLDTVSTEFRPAQGGSAAAPVGPGNAGDAAATGSATGEWKGGSGEVPPGHREADAGGDAGAPVLGEPPDTDDPDDCPDCCD